MNKPYILTLVAREDGYVSHIEGRVYTGERASLGQLLKLMDHILLKWPTSREMAEKGLSPHERDSA